MSLAKSLTEEQIATIQSWADGGDGLSEIQSKLGSELDAKVTYLETRFLLEDIGVELKKEPEPEPEPEAEEEVGQDVSADSEALPESGDASGGELSLTIDKLQRLVIGQNIGMRGQQDSLVTKRLDVGRFVIAGFEGGNAKFPNLRGNSRGPSISPHQRFHRLIFRFSDQCRSLRRCGRPYWHSDRAWC